MSKKFIEGLDRRDRSLGIDIDPEVRDLAFHRGKCVHFPVTIDPVSDMSWPYKGDEFVSFLKRNQIGKYKRPYEGECRYED